MPTRYNQFDFLNNSLPITNQPPGITQWTNHDSLENYEQRGNKDVPVDSVWYNFNSLGYRCDEFDASNTKQTIFIGCSVTVGEGVALEDTWAHLTYKDLQKVDPSQNTFINLSQCGSSWDYAVRTLIQVVPILKPKRVIAYLPSIYRREILYPGDIGAGFYVTPIHFIPDLNHNDYAAYPVMSKLSTHNEYVAYRTAMNLRTLELTCSAENTELILACWDKDFNKIISHVVKPAYGKVISVNLPGGFCAEPRARDGSHPGTAVHKTISSEFLKALR